MKALLINKCSDPMMWYASHVGKIVPLLRSESDENYFSREPAGYSNIIRKVDVEVVDVDSSEISFIRERDIP